MQKHIKSLILALLFMLITSCSTGISIYNINKPFYEDFKKYVKVSYKEYGSYAPDYKEYYEDGKYEVDRSAIFRNQAIDSLNLLEKDNWLLVQQSGTGYSGIYEETYIFSDNRCFFIVSQIMYKIKKM